MREEDCLGAGQASSELDVEDDTNDTLNEDCTDGLKHLQDDRVCALVAGPPQAVPNGPLCLKAEEQGGGKAVDGKDTWSPARVLLLVRKMIRLQVPMEPEGEVPDEGEDEPGDQAADEQNHQVLQEAPLGNNTDRVGKEMTVLHRILNIYVAIFLNNSFLVCGHHSSTLD